MDKNNKILLIIFGYLFFGIFIFYSVSPEFLQGRFSTRKLPSYNENRCYDSDGGKNFEEKGSIYGKPTTSEFGIKTDTCITQTIINEYYCDGKFIKNEEHSCENFCVDGACYLPPCEGNICNEWKKLKTIDTLNNTAQLILINNQGVDYMIAVVTVANEPDNSGVFISIDSGKSWDKTLNGFVNKIVYNKQNNSLYAVESLTDDNVMKGKLSKSIDFGNTWLKLADFQNPTRNILVDNNNNDKLYVFTQQNDFEFFVSNNGGIDWEHMAFNYFSYEFIPWAVAQNNEYLFVGGEFSPKPSDIKYRPPLYRSSDGGLTWTNIFPDNSYHLTDIELLEDMSVFQQEAPQFYIGDKNGDNITLGGSLPYNYGLVVESYADEIFFGTTQGNLYSINKNFPSDVDLLLNDGGSPIGDIDFDGDKMYITTYDGILIFEKK